MKTCSQFTLNILTSVVLSLATTAHGQVASRGVFHNVLDYGAAADGQTKCTSAIRKAIETAASQGGGTIYFPAGTYLTGPIHLQSHITLFVDAGATLKFSTDFEDYLPLVPSRWEGVEVVNFSPLIYASNAENIAIRGRGKLDGQGKAWWDYWFKVRAGNAEAADSPWQRAFREANPNTAVSTTVGPGRTLDFLRPPFIQPYHCTNVFIEGVTVVNSPFWTVSPLYCDNVTIHAITVENPEEGPNTDGINPDSCRNVHISNCHITVGDDCITIKSGRDEDGRRVGRPAENYTIVNCTMLNGHGGVVIGSEMSGGVKNITIANCVFDGTDRGIRMKSTRGRGGVVEDVRVSNVVMRNVRDQAIRLNMFYTRTEPEPLSERTPSFRNIHFNGITGDAKVACELIGLEEMPIQNITFSDIQLETTTGFSVTRGKDIEFHNIKVNTRQGPVIEAVATDRLEIDAVKTTRPHAGTPVIELRQVKNVFVHGSSAVPGTETFVRIDKESAGEVKLEANDFRHVMTLVEQ